MGIRTLTESERNFVASATKTRAYSSPTMADVFKTEGTTRTYGQDIVLPGESSNTEPQLQATPSAIVPEDTIVTVVENTENVIQTACGFVITTISPKTKSSVAMAAAAAIAEGGSGPRTSVVVRAPTYEFRNPPPTSYAIPGSPVNTYQSAIQKSITSGLVNNIATFAPNVINTATVVGSTVKTKPEIRRALEESQKVDLLLTVKSRESESLDFNTIKIPEVGHKFNYNFFYEGEEIVEREEDVAFDPLLKNKPINVPKYVRFDWEPVRVTDPVTGTELDAKKHETFRIENFFKPKGVATDLSSLVPNSIENFSSKTAPVTREGVQQKITDIHSPEDGFRSIANRDSFRNSISTTVVRSDSSEVVSLPILEMQRR